MESHALHGDGIYYKAADRLWVNLYAPSTAEWTAAGINLKMETDFPEGESVTLQMTLRSPIEFILALRRPYWAGDGFSVKVNGETILEDIIDPYRDVPESGRPVAGRGGVELSGSYVELKRTWKTGDTIELTLPKTLSLEPTPDNPRIAAIMWGPLVLAADLGPERERGRRSDVGYEPPTIPVFVAAEKPVDQWVKPVPGQPGDFRITGVGFDSLGADLEIVANLVPFYRLHGRAYAVYFDLFTPPEWEEKKAGYVAEQERLRKLENVTVAYAQPGEMQPERDFNYQGSDDTRVIRVMGRAGRRSGKWFSFDLPVEPVHPMALVVTYYSDDRSRRQTSFDILVDGLCIGHQEMTRSRPPRFLDVVYPIDSDIVKGKKKVTVRFEATEGNTIATVFGIRMIRDATDI